MTLTEGVDTLLTLTEGVDTLAQLAAVDIVGLPSAAGYLEQFVGAHGVPGVRPLVALTALDLRAFGSLC